MAVVEALLEKIQNKPLQKESLMTLSVATSSKWTQGHILLRDTRRKHVALTVSGCPLVTLST